MTTHLLPFSGAIVLLTAVIIVVVVVIIIVIILFVVIIVVVVIVVVVIIIIMYAACMDCGLLPSHTLQIIHFLIVCCLFIFIFHLLCFSLTESETKAVTKALAAFSFSVAIETRTGEMLFLIFAEMRLIFIALA